MIHFDKIINICLSGQRIDNLSQYVYHSLVHLNKFLQPICLNPLTVERRTNTMTQPLAFIKVVMFCTAVLFAIFH